METGTVKWFSKEKGFGFIVPDGGDGDVFFHASTLPAEFQPDTGDRVEFNAESGRKGMRAKEIRRVN